MIGKYVIGPRLAVGGMGEIFVAFESGIDKPPLRALKLLLPHLSESRDAIQMFLNEAQLTVRMNHPNVVRLFDVGAAEGRYFLVMELVHGMALSTLIRALKDQDGRVPASVVSFIGRALCEALNHAHALTMPDGTHLEVIHRDVTPDNVLVSVGGEVKLSDFGIAKARATASSTRPGSFKGKYEYAAPEQLRRGPIDHRVDIFGLGLTLYQLASLNSPFRRDNEMATLNAIAHEPLPSLAKIRPDLPEPLVAAINGATQKDPAQRTPNAMALHDALPALGNAQTELAELMQRMCKEPLDKLEAKVAQAESMIVEQPATPRKGASSSRPAQRSSGSKPRLTDSGAIAKPKPTPSPTERPAVNTAPHAIPGLKLKRGPLAIAAGAAVLVLIFAIWALHSTGDEGKPEPARPIALAQPVSPPPKPPEPPVVPTQPTTVQTAQIAASPDAGVVSASTPPALSAKPAESGETSGSYFIF